MSDQSDLILPKVHLLGGSLPPELDRHLFGIELECAPIITANGEDVTGLTAGLRVLLQDMDLTRILPDPTWEDATGPQSTTARGFHRPLVLLVRGAGKQRRGELALRKDKEPTGVHGGVLLLTGTSEPTQRFEVTVAPILNESTAWPRQPTPLGLGSRIALPPLRLVSGGIPIWIGSKSPLGEYLQIEPVDAKTGRILGLLDAHLTPPPPESEEGDPAGLEALLTPDGLEFFVYIPTLPNFGPIPGADSPECRVRLRWNDDAKERERIPYLLQLLDARKPEEAERYELAISTLLNRLLASDAPLVVDYDTRPAVPPLSWLVRFADSSKDSLRLVGGRSGAQWTDWTARVDLKVVRARLLTRLAAGSEFSVAEIDLHRFEVGLAKGVFRTAINAGSSLAVGSPITTRWELKPGGWIPGDAGLPLNLSISVPVRNLKERLLKLYQRGGGLPPDAAQPVFAFAPLADGWLQLPLPGETEPSQPLPAPDEPEKKVETQGLSGIYHSPLDAASHSAEGMNQRRLSIFNAAVLAVTVDWQHDGSLASVQSAAFGAYGQVDGLLFVAATSPSPVEALPSLAGGPAASRSLPIVFGRKAEDGDWLGEISTLTDRVRQLRLNPPAMATPFRAWLPPDPKLPYIPVMPLTRTVASALVPSRSRGLVPTTMSDPIVLEWSAPQVPVPSLDRTGWAWDEYWMETFPAPSDSPAPGFASINLTLPALPGVIVRPGAKDVKDPKLAAALRFDLAILDELFARSSLPRPRKPQAPGPQPGEPPQEAPRPTALQPYEMKTHWEASLRQLQLSETDEAIATPWVPVKTTKECLITNLIQPLTWTVSFGVTDQPKAVELPIGGMTLGGALTPPEALQGLNADHVPLQGGATTTRYRCRGFGGSLFAEGEFLWDSRGFGCAPVPKKDRAVVLRPAEKRMGENGGFTLVTRRAPFEFSLVGRKVQFWYCNLPCQTVKTDTQAELVFNGQATPYEADAGFAGEAFDPAKLPVSAYEWRLFPGDSQRYDLPMGPLAFRPLALENVTLTSKGDLKAFSVIGSVRLDPGAPAPGKMGPDEPREHENLARLKYRADNPVPTLEAFDDQPLEFELELTASTTLGDQKTVDSLTAGRLTLIVNESGIVNTNRFRAQLTCRLFGKVWRLEQQEGESLGKFSESELDATFHPPSSDQSQAFDVGPMKLSIIGRNGQWKPRLDVPVVLDLPVELRKNVKEEESGLSGAPALRWSQGETRWLGLQLNGLALDIDHTTGRVRLPIAPPGVVTGQLFVGFALNQATITGLLELLPFGSSLTGGKWPRAVVPAAWWLEVTAHAEGTRVQHRMTSRPLEPDAGAASDNTEAAADARLTITRTVSGKSGISWPLEVKYQTLPPVKDDERATRIEFGVLGKTFTDTVTVAIVDHELPMRLLVREGVEVRLGEAWHCLATVRHSLQQTGGQPLTWLATEYVSIGSIETLRRDAETLINEKASGGPGTEKSPLAFTARNRKNSYRGEDSKPQMRHPGLATTALAASGFTDPHLLTRLTKEASSDHLVLLGGAPTRFTWRKKGVAYVATTAFVLADGPFHTSPGTPTLLANLQQAAEGNWKLSNFDLLPISQELDRSETGMVLFGSSEVVIRKSVERTFTTTSGEIARAAAPVQQSFFAALDASGKPTPGAMPADASKLPYFLATLMKLRAALPHWRGEAPEVDTMIAATFHGATARLRVQEFVKKAPPVSTPSVIRPVRLVALGDDGETAVSASLSIQVEGLLRGPEGAHETPVTYFLGIARTLVRQPRCILLTSVEGAAGLPLSIDLPSSPDEASLEFEPTAEKRLRHGVSPALGWPSAAGISEAAALAMSFRDGDAFSDRDSGFAGRTERFTLPAYSPRPPDKTAPFNGLFLRLGTHVEFKRLAGAASVGPVARHLTPSRVRHRTPTSGSIREALNGVTLDKTSANVSPITPTEVQRGDLGSRPGVFQLYSTSVVVPADPGGQEILFDPDVPRYGRPATGGPPVIHQLRSPRSPVFPADEAPEEFALRRRTYVSLADRNPPKLPPTPDDGKLLPFIVYDDAVAVLRHEPTPDKSARLTFAVKSPAAVDASWNGVIELQMSHTLHGIELLEVLNAVGLLKEAKVVAQFSFQVGTQSFPMNAKFTKPVFGLSVTHRLDQLQEALASADADTPIAVVATMIPQSSVSTGPTSPPASLPLPAGPPRVLRVPVLLDPGSRPTLAVRRQTLVFADPSYDRQLGSETASASVRIDQGTKVLMLALDRRAYDLASTVFFAAGIYEETTNRLVPGNHTIRIRFVIEPAGPAGQDLPPPRPLRVATNPSTNEYSYSIEHDVPVFAVPMSGFIEDSTGLPVEWKGGDRLTVLATVLTAEGDQKIRVSVEFVENPVLPPNPAVFSLLRAHGNERVDVPLHATAPLPADVEFPNLKADLGAGYVRRRGLFTWMWSDSARVAKQSAYLIKVDRAGGAQLPAAKGDFRPADPAH